MWARVFFRDLFDRCNGGYGGIENKQRRLLHHYPLLSSFLLWILFGFGWRFVSPIPSICLSAVLVNAYCPWDTVILVFSRFLVTFLHLLLYLSPFCSCCDLFSGCCFISLLHDPSLAWAQHFPLLFVVIHCWLILRYAHWGPFACSNNACLFVCLLCVVVCCQWLVAVCYKDNPFLFSLSPFPLSLPPFVTLNCSHGHMQLLLQLQLFNFFGVPIPKTTCWYAFFLSLFALLFCFDPFPSSPSPPLFFYFILIFLPHSPSASYTLPFYTPPLLLFILSLPL